MRLLYVSDHRVDAYLLKSLRQAGHVVEATAEPADGVEMAAAGAYDGIILDWTSPSAVCVARFAAAAPQTLAVMIATSADDVERTAVLDAGADACFVRPASFIELETRLQALARLVSRGRPSHAPPGDPQGALELLAGERSVRVNGKTIALTRQEYQVAEHLVAHAGEVIALERLGQQVWGDEAEPRPELVRTSIARLRRKLATAQADGLLRVVKGHGYVLDPA